MQADRTAREATIDALKETVAGLSDANLRMRERLDAEWEKPKQVFTWVTIVVGVLIGVQVLNQLYVISEFSRRSGELSDKLKESSQALTTAKADMEALKTDINQKVETSIATLRGDGKKETDRLAVIASQHTQALEAEVVRQQLAISTDADAHRILSLLHLAQDHLALRRDPRRANYYANMAMKVYDRAKRAIVTQGAANKNLLLIEPVLEGLATSIWRVQAECLLQLGDGHALSQVAEQIMAAKCDGLTKDCDLRTGHYYQGVAALQQLDGTMARLAPPDLAALDEANQRDINSLQEQAIGAFTNSISIGRAPDESLSFTNDGSIDMLFLAGCLVDTGQYAQANEILDEFLRANYASEIDRQVRLPSQIRAQIAIAQAFQQVAKFVLGTTDDLEPFTCELDAGAIGAAEGAIIEGILDRLIRGRTGHSNARSRVASSPAADADTVLGLFGVDVIASLRRACQHQPAAGRSVVCESCAPGGSNSQEEAIRDDLRAKYRLAERSGLPAYSKDSSLGRVIGDFRYMKFVSAYDEVVEKQSGNTTYTVVQTKLHDNFVRYSKDEREIPARPYVELTEADIADAVSTTASPPETEPQPPAAPTEQPPAPAENDA